MNDKNRKLGERPYDYGKLIKPEVASDYVNQDKT
jgi:hypothetical protein